MGGTITGINTVDATEQDVRLHAWEPNLLRSIGKRDSNGIAKCQQMKWNSWTHENETQHEHHSRSFSRVRYLHSPSTNALNRDKRTSKFQLVRLPHPNAGLWMKLWVRMNVEHSLYGNEQINGKTDTQHTTHTTPNIRFVIKFNGMEKWHVNNAYSMSIMSI